MIDANRYYMSDPRQPLYTAAILYLFQDATDRQNTWPADESTTTHMNTNVNTRFKGDMEIFEIRYSVSLASAISMWLGIFIMVLYAFVILTCPREALKSCTQLNQAAHVAQMLVDRDIMYASSLHRRQLQLANGTVIETDEYTVERIMLANVHTPHHAIVMS